MLHFGRHSWKCGSGEVIPERFLFVSDVMLCHSDSPCILKTLDRQVRSLSGTIRIREESLPYAASRRDVAFQSLISQVEYLPQLTARRGGHDPEARRSRERGRYEHPLIFVLIDFRVTNGSAHTHWSWNSCPIASPRLYINLRSHVAATA